MKQKKLIGILLISLLLSACQQSNEKKIGIILPVENKSLDEMVKGFSESLRTNTKEKIAIKVANAQGDMNLQHAIIDQMKNEKYDMIVPIGSQATQMALASIPKQNIVSLASSFNAEDRAKLSSCNITVVHDEISPKQIMEFVHKVYPNIKQLSLIHSAADKIFPDVSIAVAAGKTMGITVKPVMITTLNDLYSVTRNLDSQSQGILVLKDLLVTSGIATIVQIAEKNHLPLITSDQGSVQDGALFALGVHEREIGIEGAKLAASVLAGEPICNLPLVDMKKLTVFVNNQTFQKTQLSLSPVKIAADRLSYRIEIVDDNKNASATT